MIRRLGMVSLLLVLASNLYGGEILVEGHAEDQFGESHDLQVLAKGFLVVDFAAVWCEPCYKVLPKLEALARQHPETRFVVVSVDASPADRDRLLEELGLTLPVLWHAGHRIVEEFAPKGFPATYVVSGGRVTTVALTLRIGKRWLRCWMPASQNPKSPVLVDEPVWLSPWLQGDGLQENYL